MTWTSLRKPLGKSGRRGRSQRREVRISFLARTAFALEVTAGKTAGCGEFFAVVDGQGEKSPDPGEGWRLRLRRRTGWSPLWIWLRRHLPGRPMCRRIFECRASRQLRCVFDSFFVLTCVFLFFMLHPFGSTGLPDRSPRSKKQASPCGCGFSRNGGKKLLVKIDLEYERVDGNLAPSGASQASR